MDLERAHEIARRDMDRLRPGGLIACDYPERPFDPEFTAVVDECRACVVALGAAARQWPNMPIEQVAGYGNESGDEVTKYRRTMQITTLRDLYEQLRVKHGLPPI